MQKNILIVEDQEGIRKLLTEVFSQEGYQVRVATTGKEALQAFDHQSFELLMIDYKLPQMNGIEVIHALVERGETVPVILMSGLTEKLTDEEIASPLIQHVISKPFDIIHLKEIVQTILTAS